LFLFFILDLNVFNSVFIKFCSAEDVKIVYFSLSFCSLFIFINGDNKYGCHWKSDD